MAGLVPTAHRGELDLNFVATRVFVPIQDAEGRQGLLVSLGLGISMNEVAHKLRAMLVQNYGLVAIHQRYTTNLSRLFPDHAVLSLILFFEAVSDDNEVFCACFGDPGRPCQTGCRSAS